VKEKRERERERSERTKRRESESKEREREREREREKREKKQKNMWSCIALSRAPIQDRVKAHIFVNRKEKEKQRHTGQIALGKYFIFHPPHRHTGIEKKLKRYHQRRF
jgi:hypothetical protein